jgi:uronate dehydrogenase
MRRELQGVYPILRLSDRTELDAAGPGEEVVVADLRCSSTLDGLLDGVDGLIHLGGLSTEHDWDDILPINIDATYRVFERAHAAGVRRIVFASSNHAIGFYPRQTRLTGDERPRADSRYGLSKVFGEALGQYFADNYGLEVLSIRIGWCWDKPDTPRALATWVSIRDLTALCRVGLETPTLHHEIVWGLSDNATAWWNNSVAFRLGFKPQDSSDAWADAVAAKQVPEEGDAVHLGVQGGVFASREYDGDPTRVVPTVSARRQDRTGE